MTKRILAAASIAIAALPASGLAQTTCVITEKLQCAEGQGCATIGNTIVVRLDIPSGLYSRCDAKGCDDLNATFSGSGEYIIIDVLERGMMAKVRRDGSGFLEVVTLMSAVLLSFGSCK